MSRFSRVIGRELRELVAPSIFFFIAFGLLVITQALVLEEYGIQSAELGKAAIGALVAGKIFLIADRFPFINRFPGRPLIYNTLWKAFIYNVAALLFRYLERVIPLIGDKGSFGAANDALLAAISWPHFLLVQLWLAVLFLGYCAARELIRAVGRDRVRELFFGRKTPA